MRKEKEKKSRIDR